MSGQLMTENKEELPSSKIEQVSEKPNEEAPKVDIAKLAAEHEELKSRYNALENVSKGAIQRAERADATLAQMTESLRTAASRVSERSEPAPDIRDQLAEDPVGVLDRHYAARTGPIVESVQENLARMNRETARIRWANEKIPGTDKSVLDVYGEKVDEFLGNLPSASKANSDAYDAALKWVRGENFEGEMQMRLAAIKEQEQRAFAEGPSSAATGAPVKKTLTDVERTIAKGLGVSDEDYISYRDGAV